MTIVYTPEGGAAVSLAGAETDVSDGPRDLHGGASAIVQEEAIVGAAYPARFARGNRSYQVSFSVRKPHATYAAAVLYWLGHLQEFNNLGSLVITQGASTLTLTKASVEVDGFPNGATSEWNYRVTGIKT